MCTNDPKELFSEKAQDLINEVIVEKADTLDDLIKVQEASNRSYVITNTLKEWGKQQNEERKLRKLYSICFIVILSFQILAMNSVLILLASNVLNLDQNQFNVFFISMFGEITALVLIITRYLFNSKNGINILEIMNNLKKGH